MAFGSCAESPSRQAVQTGSCVIDLSGMLAMWQGRELPVILILRDTERLLHAAKNDFPDGHPAVEARAISTVFTFLIFPPH